MVTIRQLVVSDLHLGERNSVLTDPVDPGALSGPVQSNAAMDAFVAALRRLAALSDTPPQLVLNGDAFGLALATETQAFTIVEQFLEKVFAPGDGPIQPTVLVLPGNHDHSLWKMFQHNWYGRLLDETGPGDPMPTVPLVTSLRTAVEAPQISGALRRRCPGLRDLALEVAYPNYLEGEGEHVLILHHGHFIEAQTLWMTSAVGRVFDRADDELTVADLESDNSAWITFLWSSLGQEGAVGRSIARAYDLLVTTPGRVVLADRITDAASGRTPGLVHRMIRPLARRALVRVMDQLKGIGQIRATDPLNEKAKRGLARDVGGPLARDLRTEAAGRGRPGPTKATFVFGHTHRPFAATETVEAFPDGVLAYNTGGWVVDSPEPWPSTGGGIVAIGDGPDAVLVHLYRQSADPMSFTPIVRHAEGVDADSALLRACTEVVVATEEPWVSVTREIGAAVLRRRDELVEHFKEEEAELVASGRGVSEHALDRQIDRAVRAVRKRLDRR